MNILSFEFRKYFPSSFIWAISLSGFGYLCIQLFIAFTKDMTFFEQVLSSYSPEFLKAFGAQLETISSLPGFYSFCFMYIILCGAFQALYLGVCVISKEMAGKSADFLYTKPVSRYKILSYKLLSVFLCIVFVNIIYSAVTYFGAYNVDATLDQGLFLTINFALFFTQILFLSFGFLLGCVMKKIKSPLSLASGIVCCFFLLQMIVNLEPDGMLSYLSFLSYLSADSILANQGFETIKLAILIILSLVFLISGYVIFQRKDIHAL